MECKGTYTYFGEFRFPDLVDLAVLHRGTVVGNYCVVVSNTELPPDTILPNNSVIWGPERRMRVQTNAEEVNDKKEAFPFIVPLESHGHSLQTFGYSVEDTTKFPPSEEERG